MKLKKLRLAVLQNNSLGVFEEPVDGSTGPAHLSVEILSPLGEYLLQRLIASSDLINAANTVLDFIDSHKSNDNEYNAAVLNLKRALLLSIREPKLSSILWRDEFFDATLRALSKEKSTDIPVDGAPSINTRITRPSRTTEPLNQPDGSLLGNIVKRFFK